VFQSNRQEGSMLHGTCHHCDDLSVNVWFWLLVSRIDRARRSYSFMQSIDVMSRPS